MTVNVLADLDELVLQCRDERARGYIVEAVGCYRAGALRSSIVATWIAVCYDLIDKFRELALAGDKEAEKLVSEIERTRRSNDIGGALKIERSLLDIARDKFELLSHIEHLDLDRLQQDRNRCAHPSLISEEQAFNPSGELARLHIRSAVAHLLQHPPAQGKYALERLVREVDSEYFPIDVAKATSSLSSGPLRRPRESLIRNFGILLFKRILQDDLDSKARARLFSALGALRALHSAEFGSLLADKLTALVEPLPDSRLPSVLVLLRNIEDSWGYLSSGVHHRVEAYVQELPAIDLSELDFLLDYKPLKSQAIMRLKKTTRDELAGAWFFILPKQVADRFIDIYLASKNWAEANAWAKHLAAYATDFSPEQQRRLLTGISSNGEVSGSFEVATVIKSLRQTKKLKDDEFTELLLAHGLEAFVSGAPG